MRQQECEQDSCYGYRYFSLARSGARAAASSRVHKAAGRKNRCVMTSKHMAPSYRLFGLLLLLWGWSCTFKQV